jgi:hypothetical protein
MLSYTCYRGDVGSVAAFAQPSRKDSKRLRRAVSEECACQGVPDTKCLLVGLECGGNSNARIYCMP